MRRPVPFPSLLLGLALAACAGHSHDRHDRAAHQGTAHEATAHRSSDAMGAKVRSAVAVLVPVGDSGVGGTIRFDAVEGGVRVHGRIEGLAPGEHGFHVHEFGDLGDRLKGQSAGSHFDPHGKPHGRPTDEARHAGDLGNVTADARGLATVDLVDRGLRLDGPDSILGRSLVVHEKADQFTQPVGDAGGRVAFGVIGIAKDGK